MNETELIASICAGDHAAFKQLFDAYVGQIFNLCYRMLGNREEAEDATQDVFLNAYKSMKRLRSDARICAWLYRIAVNHCINHQKRKKRAQLLSLDALFATPHETAIGAITSPGEPPDLALEKSESARAVQRAIDSLPEQQRTAVILHRYEGFSYQEIADVMGCSVSSVESRLHRAKRSLAKKLLAVRTKI